MLSSSVYTTENSGELFGDHSVDERNRQESQRPMPSQIVGQKRHAEKLPEDLSTREHKQTKRGATDETIPGTSRYGIAGYGSNRASDQKRLVAQDDGSITRISPEVPSFPRSPHTLPWDQSIPVTSQDSCTKSSDGDTIDAEATTLLSGGGTPIIGDESEHSDGVVEWEDVPLCVSGPKSGSRIPDQPTRAEPVTNSVEEQDASTNSQRRKSPASIPYKNAETQNRSSNVQRDAEKVRLHAAYNAGEGSSDNVADNIPGDKIQDNQVKPRSHDEHTRNDSEASRPTEVNQSSRTDNSVKSSQSKPSFEAYAPISDTFHTVDNPSFEKYASHLVFESDPCPADWVFYGFSRNSINDVELKWIPEKEGNHRVKVDGDVSRKRFKSDGFHMEDGSILRRCCAAEKLYRWRDQGPIRRQGKERFKARHITLDMGVPIGPQSEPSLWAEKIANLSRQITRLMKGSFIVIKTDIPACAYAAKGTFRPYIDAIRQLMTKFPENVSVHLNDESILDADPTSFYEEEVDIEDEFEAVFDRPAVEEDYQYPLSRRDRLLKLYGTSIGKLEHDAWSKYGGHMSDQSKLEERVIDEVEDKYQQMKQEWKDERMSFHKQREAAVDQELDFCKEFFREVQRCFSDGGKSRS